MIPIYINSAQSVASLDTMNLNVDDSVFITLISAKFALHYTISLQIVH